MAAEIWTYQDAVEHLLDVFDLDSTSRNVRLARASILNAYRDMPNRKRWAYYDRQMILTTAASQETGTIAYDHTGGSSERLVTLSGATWPDWAEHGRLRVGTSHYEIDKLLTSTTLTLRSDSNPGSDVAAGETYTIYRNCYPLPDNFRKIDQIWDRPNQRPIPLLSADALHTSLQFFYGTPNVPWMATIRNDGEYTGGMSLQFGPPPVSVRNYDLMYQAKARDLNTFKYATGTVALTSGSSTVTGTGTAFASAHVGCQFRLSTDGTSEPTSRIGNRTSNLDNPSVFESVIRSVVSATSITLVDSATATVSGKKFTISDPIDLEAGAMFTAFQKGAEYEFARMTKREDRSQWEADALKAMRLAFESDDRAETQLGEFGFTWYRQGTISTS